MEPSASPEPLLTELSSVGDPDSGGAIPRVVQIEGQVDLKLSQSPVHSSATGSAGKVKRQ